MEHLLQRPLVQQQTNSSIVSILIFMEHLLQQIENLLGLTPAGRFNPYFYGTSTSTTAVKRKDVTIYKVSILIFMEHLLQHS